MENFKLGIYKHFKGGLYRAFEVVTHSETREQYVLYQRLYDNPEAMREVRPLAMWIEEVERDGKRMKRFEFVKTV